MSHERFVRQPGPESPPGDSWSVVTYSSIISATETCRYPPPTDATWLRGPAHCLVSTPAGQGRGLSRQIYRVASEARPTAIYFPGFFYISVTYRSLVYVTHVNSSNGNNLTKQLFKYLYKAPVSWFVCR